MQEQLLECEPLASAFRVGRGRPGSGPRHRVGRRRATGGGRGARPAAARAHRPRSGCACHAHSRIRCARSRSDAGWTGTIPVVWIPAPPIDADELVPATRKPAPLELAGEEQPRPRPKPIGEPGLVEPHRVRRTASIGHAGLDDPKPRRLLVGRTRAVLTSTSTVACSPDAELGELPNLAAVAVAMGDVRAAGRRRSRCRAPKRLPRAAGRRPRSVVIGASNRLGRGSDRRVAPPSSSGGERVGRTPAHGRSRRGSAAIEALAVVIGSRLGFKPDGTNRRQAGGARPRAPEAVRRPVGSRVQVRSRSASAAASPTSRAICRPTGIGC